MVVHRWCPRVEESRLEVIGRSRSGNFEHKARPETLEAFGRMQKAAKASGVRLHVIWAYRSPVLQKEQFEEAEVKYGRGKGIRWLAPSGYSEHQTGWVLDIGDWDDPEADDNPLFERTKAFEWLKAHANQYDFELSFPPGNWQGVATNPGTGGMSEPLPRTRRFIRVDLERLGSGGKVLRRRLHVGWEFEFQ